MEKVYLLGKRAVLAIAVLLVMGQTVSAQRLQLNELLALQSQPVEKIRTTLESRGWIYDGQCGGSEEVQRHCFKIGDGKSTSLAAVLYVEGNAPSDQVIEYSVFRQNLISQVQNNIRNAAAKLLRQEPVSKDVKLRIYQKDKHILVLRGGLDKQYYSVKVQQRPAYERMQAAR
ncbi:MULTISPECIES: hypothetical protein [Rufibacter]|uniref:Uncharacterized protein n=1 Tax=Rufibacter quisquiliarum TaxID=1549639 RepID=A0A839GFP9_9BACT|nr:MULTISPECIES: hypothetical protein [Rufibacter]MBA9078474.1 hypothetical protein [Rufibacter quisquiliarum]